MKQAVATLLVQLVLICNQWGNVEGFLDQEEIDRVQQVIENNRHYPALPNRSENHSKALVFGLIMSFGGNIDSSGAVSGVRVALDRINNDSSLLPGYTLHYALSDSRVRQISVHSYTLGCMRFLEYMGFVLAVLSLKYGFIIVQTKLAKPYHHATSATVLIIHCFHR